MERIKFEYEFGADFNDNTTTHRIESTVADRAEEGLNVNTVCEAFADFMESIGYSMEQVAHYFEE